MLQLLQILKEDLTPMKKKHYILLSLLSLALVAIVSIYLLPLNGEADESWPEEGDHVQIVSSVDNELQDAYFISSENEAPLIVSLHQWSASYDNFDSISEHAVTNDWNYIRPNFRGPNNNPQAGGSELAVNDIDDAINYAIEYGNVDEAHIHIIGASGGGHVALQHLMTSDYEVASYSAWVPITDLVAWFGESRIRDTGYDEDILAITESEENNLNVQEARDRSPLFQKTPIEKVSNTIVQIYAGINDGYDGSVPISHSIRFFNKLVEDLDFGEENLVPQSIESELLYTQNIVEDSETTFSIGDRDIIYNNEVENLSLVIFDGDHEILNDEAFEILLGIK